MSILNNPFFNTLFLEFLNVSFTIEHFKSKSLMVYQADVDTTNIYSLRQKRAHSSIFLQIPFEKVF